MGTKVIKPIRRHHVNRRSPCTQSENTTVTGKMFPLKPVGFHTINRPTLGNGGVECGRALQKDSPTFQ